MCTNAEHNRALAEPNRQDSEHIEHFHLGRRSFGHSNTLQTVTRHRIVGPYRTRSYNRLSHTFAIFGQAHGSTHHFSILFRHDRFGLNYFIHQSTLFYFIYLHLSTYYLPVASVQQLRQGQSSHTAYCTHI
jgi:hypothetical protein